MITTPTSVCARRTHSKKQEALQQDSRLIHTSDDGSTESPARGIGPKLQEEEERNELLKSQPRIPEVDSDPKESKTWTWPKLQATDLSAHSWDAFQNTTQRHLHHVAMLSCFQKAQDSNDDNKRKFSLGFGTTGWGTFHTHMRGHKSFDTVLLVKRVLGPLHSVTGQE
jgi:hypothetical protein